MQKLKTNWEFVADTVMGGKSRGQIDNVGIQGRNTTRLNGMVSLENNGGFIQMASDLQIQCSDVDADDWQGVELDVVGNDSTYDIRLRTVDLDRPWQSFRASFHASARWKTIKIPFSKFEPHKTDKVLKPATLRRLGIVAIGRVFFADVAVAEVRLY